MITKEQKDKWLQALRSGEYKQTRHRLFSGKGYCCLGVYCKAVEGLKLKRAHVEDGSENEKIYRSLQNQLGDYYLYSDLMSMNDTGKTFPEIADFIQENLPCAN